MLKQAAGIYTPRVYKEFEDEYRLFLNCSIRDNGQSEGVHEYIVTNRRRECIVRHDLSSDNMTCTCLKFEFMGIQCCHVVKALDFMNIKQLPEKYFLRRWRKDAKKGKKISIPQIESKSKVNLANLYSSMMRTFNIIFCTASQSEKACQYVLQVAKELMPKVEELVLEENRSYEKGSNQSNQASINETAKVSVEATSKQPTGILKKDGGKGCRRYRSCLESNKKRRKKDKSANANLTSLKPTDTSLDESLLPRTSIPTGPQSYGSAIELLSTMHALVGSKQVEDIA